VNIHKAIQSFIGLLVYCSCVSISHAQWDHELGLEFRYFFEEPQFETQSNHAASLSYKPSWSTASGNSLYDFSAVMRFDEADEQRDLIDITELSWLYALDDWEFKAGISKVFWGVAESQHLVDIINQADLVDDLSGDSKLGQPMISLTKISDYGIFDAYVLPYFRERTFAGEQGRLRSEPIVNTDSAIYESEDEQSHIDYALRWSHSINVFDLGLSYFRGTSRDPLFSLSDDQQYLIPNYHQIEQIGLDVQATVDAWLLKFEAIDRQANEAFISQDFEAAIAGLEYTFFSVANSSTDLGLVLEHSYDSRGEQSFSDGLTFIGLRLALNDEQSSDLFIGCSADGQLCTAEGSRRIAESLKLSLRANTFSGISEDSILASQSQDDFVQLSFSYFF